MASQFFHLWSPSADFSASPLGTVTSNIAVAGFLLVNGSGMRGDYFSDLCTGQEGVAFRGGWSLARTSDCFLDEWTGGNGLITVI